MWLENRRNLLLIEGILLALLGIFAVALPGIATLSAELFIGWLLIFSGAIQLYHGFQDRKARGFISAVIIGLLAVVFGILLILFPMAGILSLTILLTIFFVAEGIAKIIFSLQLRPARQWGWMLFNGIVALILAFIIWSGWPGTAFWVLGLLVGINLIFFGLSLIFLASGMPKIKI